MSLQIKNLEAEIENKKILNNFNLNVGDGEVHAIMGPNGVGKSTLSRIIMADYNYKVISGDIIFNDKSILGLKTDEISRLGIFLAMQNPMEIEGISNQDFLRTALSSREGKNISMYQFILKCEQATNSLNMNKDLIQRSLNVGFSGGEKKKNEVLQMKLLEPSLIILDELDSGLDVDNLKIVCDNILEYKKSNPKVSIIVITHYAKILEQIKPDYVHVMNHGKIVRTGNYDMVDDILSNGFNKYIDINNVAEEVNYE